MSDMTKLERRCLARVKDSPDDIDLIRAVLAEAGVAEMREALQWYADQMCEHSTSFEGCGKLTADHCAGCRARAAIAKARA